MPLLTTFVSARHSLHESFDVHEKREALHRDRKDGGENNSQGGETAAGDAQPALRRRGQASAEFAEAGDAESAQDGDHQNLRDFCAGKGFKEGARDHAEEKRDEASFFGAAYLNGSRLGIQRGGF